MVIIDKLAAILALGVAAAAAASCNAVLGIEEARLDQTSEAATCALPRARPVDRCEFTTNCDRCVNERCEEGEVQACVEDPACRKALTNHRICIQDDCRDEDGTCGECLGEVPKASCLADCAQACTGGELVSLCELFCACMAANCPNHHASDCLETCRNTPDWELECVLTHCERAEDPGADHCLHATHELRQCPETPPDPEAMASCEAPLGLIGYGCGQHGDCCSGFCRDGSCQD
jgi:hypothetical protein